MDIMQTITANNTNNNRIDNGSQHDGFYSTSTLGNQSMNAEFFSFYELACI